MIATELASYVPIIVALVGGGAVALYTARPQRDSLITEAAEKAVDVVSKAIVRLERDLASARERIAILEAERQAWAAEKGNLEQRLEDLRLVVARLGGSVDEINRRDGV